MAFDPKKYAASPSGFDPVAYAASESVVQDAEPTEGPGALSRFISGLDSYTGAPVRAAIGAAADGSNPLSALWNQFGEDPSRAPTANALAERAGFSDLKIADPDQFPDFKDVAEKEIPSPRDLAAGGIDVAADLTNLLPAVAAGKGVLRGAGVLAKGAAAAKEMGPVKKVLSLPGKAASKLAATTTGVSEDAIRTYSGNTKAVDDLIRQYGENIPDAADAAKSKINRSVQARISALNEERTALLDGAKDKRVNLSPILERLEAEKSRLNSKLYPEAVKAVQDMQNKIVQVAGGFEATPKQADEIKMFLQDEARSSYQQGGKLFSGGDKVSRAAKQAASVARKEVNAAVPGVAKVNNQFQQLFDLQGKMNRNLLKEGGSEASLLSVGKDANRNRKNLEKLGDLVGEDFIGDIKNLSAMSEFSNPQLLAKDFTGKAMARQAIGGGVGYSVLGPLGLPLGAIATSPAALKQAIRLKALAGNTVGKIGKLPPKTTEALVVGSAAPESSGRKPLSDKSRKRLRAMGE